MLSYLRLFKKRRWRYAQDTWSNEGFAAETDERSPTTKMQFASFWTSKSFSDNFAESSKHLEWVVIPAHVASCSTRPFLPKPFLGDSGEGSSLPWAWKDCHRVRLYFFWGPPPAVPTAFEINYGLGCWWPDPLHRPKPRITNRYCFWGISSFKKA